MADHCVANHPSDMAAALAALDATVEAVGPGGRRSIPVEGLHFLPGDTPEKETVLERGELIVAIRVPDSPFAARSHYLKVRDRGLFRLRARLGGCGAGGRGRHDKAGQGGWDTG